MAEAILETVLGKLTSLAVTELGLFLGFDRDKEKLDSMFTAIKATLEDAEEKQFSDKKSEAIKDWLQKLKYVAYELDDIMDECAYEDKVHSSFLSSFHPKHAAFRYKIAKRMKRISDRLDEIAKEREQLHLTETVQKRISGVTQWPQTTSFITEPKIYGREKDRDEIVDFLIGDASHSEDLSVYPILGLGGLGKTTLAQLIFNHERVVNHFELRIWVCVSEDFSLKRMTKAIISAASGDDPSENLDQEQLHKRLQDLLRGKIYLLVLDDVWDDEQENWQRLKSVLACGAKGASILVTTRLSTVAEIMRTTPPHELSLLSDNDCWELFKHRAFGPNEVEQEHVVELVEIGKEIVKKCGGVPLAAKALGGFLRFERKAGAWLNVKESNLWSLPHDILPALRLSYLNLPTKLRQCFAYCAIFPKDKKIKKQYLIELWMANGFISFDGMLDAEDVGDRAWQELYWRSFFQDLETDKFGKAMSFKMHDLFHDLAKFVAKEICCITEDKDVTTLSERTFHLSDHRFFNQQIHKVKSLRTHITPPDEYYGGVVSLSSHVLLKCYSLRVLDFQGRNKLSSSIGHLKHLRYLNLSRGRFKTLSESLCRLWNLQILKLDDCEFLQKLPDSLTHLTALQQLSLKGCNSLSNLPPRIGKLTSLKNLTTYFVGKEKGFLLAELGQLKLRGDLHIKHMGKVKSAMEAEEANMSSKQLVKLALSWDGNEESKLQENVQQILEVLQPHTQHLQTLTVTGYEGAHFPQWISSPSLKYLTYLKLEDCPSCLQLPPLVKLPSLKTLLISKMINVKYLYEESYDGGVVFMALESLTLDYLPKLIRLSREDGDNMFSRLSTLSITECPNLLDLPSLPTINELRIVGKCSQDLLSSIHKLSSLGCLSIRYNEELTCFPDGMLQNLTSLTTLEFRYLPKLEVLPTEIFNVDAIQTLFIEWCNSLKLLLQGLHSLKRLVIRGCGEFNVLAGFQCLTCLEYLEIHECKVVVEGLHEASHHMTALKGLRLWSIPNLESLPDCFGNLPLLRKLVIVKCSKLTCLPASLSLSSLDTLDILDCPELEKRCQKEKGEDWPKIAHIPNVRLL